MKPGASPFSTLHMLVVYTILATLLCVTVPQAFVVGGRFAAALLLILIVVMIFAAIVTYRELTKALSVAETKA